MTHNKKISRWNQPTSVMHTTQARTSPNIEEVSRHEVGFLLQASPSGRFSSLSVIGLKLEIVSCSATSILLVSSWRNISESVIEVAFIALQASGIIQSSAIPLEVYIGGTDIESQL